MSESITWYHVNEREVVKQEVISKIDEMLEYDGMNVMPSKYALKMVRLFIRKMDDNDEV